MAISSQPVCATPDGRRAGEPDARGLGDLLEPRVERLRNVDHLLEIAHGFPELLRFGFRQSPSCHPIAAVVAADHLDVAADDGALKAATFVHAPLQGNGAYIVPKTVRESRLRRFGCGALWKMTLRESFSMCLSSWRSFR